MFYAKQCFHPGKFFYAPLFAVFPLTTIVTMILADNIKMVKELQKISYSVHNVHLHGGFVLCAVKMG